MYELVSFFYIKRSAPDLDRSFPALANWNCLETERWDRSSGPEGLGQWTERPGSAR